MMDQNTLDEARKMMADMLKKRRIELNLTQENLAEKTGLHRKTITRLEAGFVWLGMKQYLLVCEALHLFPCLVEMESTDLIAEALRKNWTSKPKAMSIEEALKLKGDRYKNDNEQN